jgi:hypothetical protein
MPATSMTIERPLRDPADQQGGVSAARKALARNRRGEVAREGDEARHAEREHRRRDGACVGTER